MIDMEDICKRAQESSVYEVVSRPQNLLGCRMSPSFVWYSMPCAEYISDQLSVVPGRGDMDQSVLNSIARTTRPGGDSGD